jgi:hypothetical protein
MTTGELDSHIATVVAQLRLGKVIPFLGAGANLSDRPELPFTPWEPPIPPNRDYLPSGRELAGYLAAWHNATTFEDSDELVRVAEWVSLSAGEGSLYDSLRELFDADYPTTALHKLMARLPAVAREQGWVPMQVIVTTNYDDLLERAYRAAGEEIDVLTYIATEGRFIHIPPDGEPRLIERGAANSYLLPQDARRNLIRPAIIKLHGAVDRIERSRDSFVISEDHYIDFLSRFNVQDLVPAPILAKLAESNFLFLGYSLRDWNVRAMLHRIWESQRHGFKSWAIQYDPGEMDQLSWQEKGVRILARPLAEYVAAMSEWIDKIPAPVPEPGANG